jgi:Tfp pilus assembly protein PilO
MDKYKKYTGLIMFLIAITIVIYAAVLIISPQYNEWTNLKENLVNATKTLDTKRQAKITVLKRLKKIQNSIISSQKKIYSPVETDLGDDTLFFTLYSDLIEMVRTNTIKIKSIDYKYSPKGDIFVQQKGSRYFVCDVNMEVVSNYVNLGKLIQDIYQYPYYIRINNIEVVPYQQDKKILLSTISMRLYAHTAPDGTLDIDENAINNELKSLEGAETPLPQ